MNKIANYLSYTVVVVGLLAIHTPAHAGGGTYTSQSINLLLLLAIFFIIAQKTLPSFLQNRAETIADALSKGQKEQEIAKSRYDQLTEEKEGLGQKITEIRKQAQEDIEAMKEKFATQIADEKVRAEISSKHSIEEERLHVQHEIRQKSAQLAVMSATEMIKSSMNAEDKQRLFTDFMQTVQNTNNHNNQGSSHV